MIMVDTNDDVVKVHTEITETVESHADYTSIDEVAGPVNDVVTANIDGTQQDHPDDESVLPIDGVGCMQGCARDRHLALTILTVVLLILPILMVAGVLTIGWFAFIESIVGVMYLGNVFLSTTSQYLRNISTTETVLDHMNQMYRTEPVISWFIQCYHHEMRTRLVATPGLNGITMLRTQTYQERVNTHSAHGKLNILRWTDVSVPLDRKSLEAFVMTKISIKKGWIGDEGADRQRTEFKLVNTRDAFYDFRETLTLSGYRTRLLGFVDLENIPVLAHWRWYVICHLTVILGVPYRMWLSSKSHKVQTTISKQIWTS